MINLKHGKHFCSLTISQDLFGLWFVTRTSSCSGWSSVNIKTFEFSNELEARQKLCDIEISKRKLGFKYVD